MPDSGIAIWQANSAIDMAMARGLFREYQQQLGIDLQFQAFDQELASLPGAYGAPRGALLLAARDGVPVGCGALRALDETRAEMKRLYVRPDARGSGAGVLLVEALVREGERLGYTQLVLDTLPSMAVAHRLYERCHRWQWRIGCMNGADSPRSRRIMTEPCRARGSTGVRCGIVHRLCDKSQWRYCR